MTASETPRRSRPISKELREHMRRIGRIGGKAGSPSKKRANVLKAWANPDPSKRPGRKKGGVKARPEHPTGHTLNGMNPGALLGSTLPS